jgi:hypothetical protein
MRRFQKPYDHDASGNGNRLIGNLPWAPDTLNRMVDIAV